MREIVSFKDCISINLTPAGSFSRDRPAEAGAQIADNLASESIADAGVVDSMSDRWRWFQYCWPEANESPMRSLIFEAGKKLFTTTFAAWINRGAEIFALMFAGKTETDDLHFVRFTIRGVPVAVYGRRESTSSGLGVPGSSNSARNLLRERPGKSVSTGDSRLAAKAHKPFFLIRQEPGFLWIGSLNHGSRKKIGLLLVAGRTS